MRDFDLVFAFLGILGLSFILVLILLILQNDRREACEMAGGKYFSDKHISLCLDPKTVFVPK